MNKRAFLHLLSTAPLMAWQTKPTKMTNWSGNITYSTDRITEATTIDEVRNTIRSLDKVKILGSRHCFNNIADSRHHLLSLKPLHDAIVIDKTARTVTVDSGITYGQLCPYLEKQGFALHNLASLPHISVGGAISTATHGSGEHNGNLATAVAALELVTASGDLIHLSRQSDPGTFPAAVVGLGALGAITKVTLDIQPTYQMRQYVYQNLPLKQMKDHFDQIEVTAYSVSLFTDWQNQRLNEVWIKVREGKGQTPFTAEPVFFGAKRATRNLHPISDLSAENCTLQMGVPGPWYERLPHFRMGFTPSAGKELQTEYLVPRQHAVDAILAVEKLRDQITPHLLISEIRTIAADDLWMSTAYQRPSVAIHFTWKPDWPAVQQLLPVIERELGPFQPRPHWGKLFNTAPKYEKQAAFIALAKKYDPKGKFRNDFLDKNVFAALALLQAPELRR